MVQVDVFWAYGLGASLASAAGENLAKVEEKPLESGFFAKVMVFLSVFWAPTGLLLLLRHPSWETMQAAENFASLPDYLVLAFGITNITQGILGFYTGWLLLRKGKTWLAHLNWMFGYFGMFFILLYGWDGLGYDRFLYDRDMFGGQPWSPGAGLQDGAGWSHLASSVAMTLYIDGIWLLPPYFYLLHKWLKMRRPQANAFTTIGMCLALVFGVTLGSAAVCALFTGFYHNLLGMTGMGYYLGYILGLATGIGALWFVVFRLNSPVFRMVRIFDPALA